MKKIRYIIEAILLAFLLGVSKLMPALWASNMGGWLGRNIGTRLAASRKAKANIKMVYPNKTDKEINKIVTGMWENLGRVILEYPHIQTIAKNHTEIVGVDIFTNNEFTSPIFISSHTGNWEVCPPAFWLQTKIKVNPVYRAPNNPFVDKMLNKKRSLNGALTPIPKSRSGTRRLVKTLQSGEGIGLLIDQKFNEGIKANFFGHPAMTSDHFVTLAQKFGCPIIPLQIERVEGINFRITVFKPLDIKDKSINEIVAETHSLLENWISKHPDQWLWLHRRWMSQTEIERYNNEHP